MSNFRDAVDAMTADRLVCPRCHEKNGAHRKPVIEFDPRTREANCSNCSYTWTVKEN